jgi:hypothetical protein
MKFLLTILLVQCVLFSNAQNFPWAKSSSTGTVGGLEKGIGVCSDLNGNIFITGSFDSQQVSFGTYSLSYPGGGWGTGGCVYLTKYDPNGNELWAKQSNPGGAVNDYGLSVCSDINGNAIVCGFYNDNTVTFGSLTLINPNLPSYPPTTLFIAKYDSNGNIVWLKGADPSPCVGSAASVATDASGNIYMTGSFSGQTNNIKFGTYTLTATSTANNIFLVKYDPNGNVLWAKNHGGVTTNMGEGGNSLTTDNIGNVFVTGYYTSPSVVFGPYTLTNTGTGFTSFLAKYDSNGNVLWAKNISGAATYPYGNMANSVSVDASGNSLVTGYFENGSINLGTYTLTNSGGADIYIAKYDPSGNVLWANKLGGSGADVSHSVSSDANHIFILAGFTQSILVGSNTYTQIPGTDPLLLVDYDLNGNILCSSSLKSGGAGQSMTRRSPSISADKFGNAHFVSDYGLNPYTVGSNTLTQTSARNIILAKYSPCQTAVNIDEIGNELNLIYPNPTSSKIYIFSRSQDFKQPELEIYNTFGELIHRTELKEEQKEVDLSDQPSGIYLIHIGTTTKKIIKE